MKAAKLEAPSPGDVVGDGRFELLSELGEGGTSLVYRAHDCVEGVEVALKLLLPRYVGRPEREQRLINEAAYLRRLRGHPHIVEFVSSGRLEDRGRWPWLATEALAGHTLDLVFVRGTLEIPRVIEIAKQVAEGLLACHAAGVVHRDATPSNVFMLDGPAGGVKLFDFSHAADLCAPQLAVGAPGRLTGVHDVPGTLGYMGPEQVCQGPADPSMDVFGFGVLLFELVTRQNPYAHIQDRGAYIQGQREGKLEAPRLAAWAYGAPEELAELVHDCTKRIGAERPSMEQIIARLRSIDVTAIASAPASTPGARPDAKVAARPTPVVTPDATEKIQLRPAAGAVPNATVDMGVWSVPASVPDTTEKMRPAPAQVPDATVKMQLRPAPSQVPDTTEKMQLRPAPAQVPDTTEKMQLRPAPVSVPDATAKMVPRPAPVLAPNTTAKMAPVLVPDATVRMAPRPAPVLVPDATVEMTPRVPDTTLKMDPLGIRSQQNDASIGAWGPPPTKEEVPEPATAEPTRPPTAEASEVQRETVQPVFARPPVAENENAAATDGQSDETTRLAFARPPQLRQTVVPVSAAAPAIEPSVEPSPPAATETEPDARPLTNNRSRIWWGAIVLLVLGCIAFVVWQQLHAPPSDEPAAEPVKTAEYGDPAPEIEPTPNLEPVPNLEPGPNLEPVPEVEPVPVPEPEVEPRLEPKPEPKPKPQPESDPCSGAADQARKALADRDWRRAASLSANRKCWSSQAERAALRVAAFSELGEWSKCVEAGSGSTDPKVRAKVDGCRMFATPETSP